MQRQRSQRTPEEKERDRERDRQRKSKTPVTSQPAVQDPSGLYLPPVGRKRIGKRWNGVIGEWVDEQLPITADEQERTSQLNAERVVKQQAQTTLGQLRTAVLACESVGMVAQRVESPAELQDALASLHPKEPKKISVAKAAFAFRGAARREEALTQQFNRQKAKLPPSKQVELPSLANPDRNSTSAKLSEVPAVALATCINAAAHGERALAAQKPVDAGRAFGHALQLCPPVFAHDSNDRLAAENALVASKATALYDTQELEQAERALRGALEQERQRVTMSKAELLGVRLEARLSCSAAASVARDQSPAKSVASIAWRLAEVLEAQGRMQSCDVLSRHQHPSFVALMARACAYGMRAIDPNHLDDPVEIAHNVAEVLTAAAYEDVNLTLNMLGRAVTLPPLPPLPPIPPIPDDNANPPLREAAELLRCVCRALESSLDETVEAPWKKPSRGRFGRNSPIFETETVSRVDGVEGLHRSCLDEATAHLVHILHAAGKPGEAEDIMYRQPGGYSDTAVYRKLRRDRLRLQSGRRRGYSVAAWLALSQQTRREELLADRANHPPDPWGYTDDGTPAHKQTRCFINRRLSWERPSFLKSKGWELTQDYGGGSSEEDEPSTAHDDDNERRAAVNDRTLDLVRMRHRSGPDAASLHRRLLWRRLGALDVHPAKVPSSFELNRAP